MLTNSKIFSYSLWFGLLVPASLTNQKKSLNRSLDKKCKDLAQTRIKIYLIILLTTENNGNIGETQTKLKNFNNRKVESSPKYSFQQLTHSNSHIF